MIFQGLFNILDLYSNEIDLFYDSIDKYFREKLGSFLEEKTLEKSELNKVIEELIEEILIYGTVQGSLLALLALGFSLVYGVGGILNLAHGAFYLITAYVIYWILPFFIFLDNYLLRFGISAAIALAVVVGIGALTYLGLMKPLQESHIGIVLVTFALAFFLRSK